MGRGVLGPIPPSSCYRPRGVPDPASPPTAVAREGIYEAGHYVEGLQRDLRLAKAQIAEMESSPTASPSVEERLRDLEEAVVYVARLIEDTLPPSHAGLHAWLKRPAVG